MPKQHSQKKVNKQKKVNRAKNGVLGGSSREARSCISWLHISDWHQGLPDFDRSVLLQGMLEDIRARSSFDPELSDIDLVVFSGDVAFSGKTTEYTVAKTTLIDPIRKLVGERARFVFAPGNHDLERDKVSEIPPDWEKLLSSRAPERQKQLGDLLYDKKKSPMMLSPFQNFYRFSKENGWPYPDGDLVHSFILERGTSKLGIATVNTAVCCGRHAIRAKGEAADHPYWDYGTLAITERQLRDAILRLRHADFKILVMHHPLSWVHEDEQAVLEQLISSNFDLVLYGHEHLPRFSSVSGNFGDIKFVPAGSAYAGRSPINPRYTNAFNFGLLNCATGEGAIHHRRWMEERDCWAMDDRYWPDGVARFLIQKKLLSQNSKYIFHALRRFKPFHSKRAGRKAEITLKHRSLSLPEGDFIDATVRYKIELHPGPAELFEFRTTTNTRIENHPSKDIRDRAFSVIKMSPKPKTQKRDKTRNNRIAGTSQISPLTTVVEYQYRMLEMDNGVWYFALGRFIDQVKIFIEKAEGFEYEFQPIGGFPDLQPGPDGLLSFETIESEGGHLPGQGYMVQWYPATGKTK
ncbi:metallophosphoesterase family protein [Bradyrhizobium guangzhouense]|uniref:metallophosphoesterase family protein n=1 Tax=Bradyrhizobium guangzhouense TaxID=1325095 RepID=UPI0013E89BE2|nr:metallophosphoesterase [Bradyrhizobium guangzhouense]